LEKKVLAFNKPTKLATKNFLVTWPYKNYYDLLLHFFYKKLIKEEKNCDHFFSIIPPTLAQIIILLFFTKHMAYNINFCEGNLEAVPAWFWCSLRTKQKTLTLFTHLTQL